MYDVIIIGGGIAGSITGRFIKGNVLIVEEHKSIGTPLQCAGIISVRAAKELDFPKGLVNKVRGAYIYSKNSMLEIESKEIKAHVYERKVMDKDIAIKTAKKCDYLLKAYATIEREKNNYIVKVKHFDEEYIFKPKVVVGADGVKSTIGKKANLIKNKDREILSSCQFEFVNVSVDDDFVYIFFDKRYSKDFFIWIIPMGKDRVRVGLLSKGNAHNNLINFIENHPVAKDILKKATPIEFSSGALPIGYINRSVRDNLLLVGDAACHVKPLSGGGIYYSTLAGKIAGNIITDYLNGEENLKNYDKEWKRVFGDDIKKGLWLRKIIYRLDNKTLDKIFNKLKDSEIIDYINKYGDIEEQAKITSHVFDYLKNKFGFNLLKFLFFK